MASGTEIDNPTDVQRRSSQPMLLETRGLKTHFFTDDGTVKAVDGVDMQIERGSVLGVVGESGCGKSVTAFSMLHLIPHPERLLEELVGGVLEVGAWLELPASLSVVHVSVCRSEADHLFLVPDEV